MTDLQLDWSPQRTHSIPFEVAIIPASGRLEQPRDATWSRIGSMHRAKVYPDWLAWLFWAAVFVVVLGMGLAIATAVEHNSILGTIASIILAVGFGGVSISLTHAEKFKRGVRPSQHN